MPARRAVARPGSANAKTAEIAAIQGNVPARRSLEAQIDELQVTLNHATATEKLAAKVAAGTLPQPDLVIWPENYTDDRPDTSTRPIYEEISERGQCHRPPDPVGAMLDNPMRNASLLWLPGKGPTTVYAKRQLVPFGEFLPFRGLISKITSLTRAAAAGHGPRAPGPWSSTSARSGSATSSATRSPSTTSSRSEVTAGANVLTVQSNDATFEREGRPPRRAGSSSRWPRLRAVEFDRAVVYDSTTGYSAIITPDGQVTQRSGLWHAGRD